MGEAMNEMVERVARAMCLANGDNPDDAVQIGPISDLKWRGMYHLAEAAITAMHEPTDDMVKAGVHVVNGWGVSGIPVWESMINAALTSDPSR